jgi:AmmeMemoRadiSam system protein A
MGKILSGYVFPHPPIVIPEVGRGNESGAQKTIDACKKAAEMISAEQPSVIIITTPHGPVFQDYVYMSMSKELKGSFANFGVPNVKLQFENDVALAESIARHAERKGIRAGGLEKRIMNRYDITGELDHGALVPLYFVSRAYRGFKLVHISISGYPKQQLYEFGMCIRDAVAESEENAVFIASGDLSHRLSHSGPYGYHPEGPRYDDMIVKTLSEMDIEKLMDIDFEFCERAGECGFRSFVMMAGAFDGFDIEPEIYSYEGPFGVGYAVGRFEVKGMNPEKKFQKKEDPYVELARKALEAYVKTGEIIDVPEGLPDEMTENRAGAFVSLKKYGQLRGCIGTISPAYSNIAQEIIGNAISAGTRDPRFHPVRKDELDGIVYSVDILGEPEPIESIDQLDVKRYGVIVRAGRRSGLLLPDLEGVDTPEEQVSIALRKAGIRPDENYRMERFEVVRHK